MVRYFAKCNTYNMWLEMKCKFKQYGQNWQVNSALIDDYLNF